MEGGVPVEGAGEAGGGGLGLSLGGGLGLFSGRGPRGSGRGTAHGDVLGGGGRGGCIFYFLSGLEGEEDGNAMR